jgi:hypothetical protein
VALLDQGETVPGRGVTSTAGDPPWGSNGAPRIAANRSREVAGGSPSMSARYTHLAASPDTQAARWRNIARRFSNRKADRAGPPSNHFKR